MMGSVSLPEKAIRAQIASAVHLIVQASRLSDGSRRITHIAEITGTSGDIISMQDLFVFEKMGLGAGGKLKGRFSATGIVPKFADKLKAVGIPMNLDSLDESVEV